MILRVGWSPAGFSLVALLLDQVLFLAAFNIAFILNLPGRVPSVYAETWYLMIVPYLYEPSYTAFFLYSWFLVSASLVAFGTYRNAYTTSFHYQSRQSLKGVFLGCSVLFLGLFLLGSEEIARDFCMTFLGFLLLLLPLFKVLIGDARSLLTGLELGRVRTIVAGESAEVAALVERIRGTLRENYALVAVCPEDPTDTTLLGLGLPVLREEELAAALPKLHPHQILYPEPVRRPEHLDRLRAFCREHDVALRLLPVRQTVAVGETRVHDLLGVPLEMPGPRSRYGVRLLLKRGMDLLLATAAVVLLSPLLVALAVLIKLDSPGPVFFLQTRLTRNGRPFRIIKFRSMYIDAEARLEQLRSQSEVTGPIFKMRNDPRVTHVGKWLRKLSLDELPQFFNVIAGQLSLVGPRPPLPSEVENYEPWQRRRLEVTSGITGLWQVSGRSMIDFEEMVLLDLYYIENWSLVLDLEILLDTVPTVLLGKGAF